MNDCKFVSASTKVISIHSLKSTEVTVAIKSGVTACAAATLPVLPPSKVIFQGKRLCLIVISPVPRLPAPFSTLTRKRIDWISDAMLPPASSAFHGLVLLNLCQINEWLSMKVPSLVSVKETALLALKPVPSSKPGVPKPDEIKPQPVLCERVAVSKLYSIEKSVGIAAGSPTVVVAW